MQEYKKKDEENSEKRYFTLDENDCYILPPREIVPELYVLGGFFNTKKAEYVKTNEPIKYDEIDNSLKESKQANKVDICEDECQSSILAGDGKNNLSQNEVSQNFAINPCDDEDVINEPTYAKKSSETDEKNSIDILRDYDEMDGDYD